MHSFYAFLAPAGNHVHPWQLFCHDFSLVVFDIRLMPGKHVLKLSVGPAPIRNHSAATVYDRRGRLRYRGRPHVFYYLHPYMPHFLVNAMPIHLVAIFGGYLAALRHDKHLCL